ncbi:MAG: YihY/virulence factor BrkB family protein [Acidimicrobiales bacterium]
MNPEQTVPPQTGDQDQPSSPLQLSPPDWKESLRRAIREFKADRGSLIAAGMGFYWFLAVFPGLLAAVGFLGLVNAGPDLVESISKAITSALPGNAAEVLTASLRSATDRPRGSSAAAALVGTGLALFSASAGMVAVQTALDFVYDVPEERPYLKKRARALLLILVAVVLGGVATTFIVFGQPLGDSLRDHLPFGAAFVLVWTVIRWAVGIAALATLFASFYYLAPNRESPRWAWISPGGIVATLIWLAASLGFSFYVSSLGNYAQTYGSLTGVVVLLLWLYLSALAVVVGGEINAELERQGDKVRRRERRRSGGARPGKAQERGPSGTQTQPATTDRPRSGPDSYEAEWQASMKRLREAQPSSRDG